LKLKINSQNNGLFVHYRDINFSNERSKLEVPLAFISHDSRDKELIATILANELQRRMLPIWYDEYSLKLGDSLRESIEKGLKECKKCILILSPNFLQNSGWTKTEFNTIFTREIIETKNLVLPIWAGVSKQEIYEYCPILVDRVGVNWDKGIETVVTKIQQVLMTE
jgi:TIR domain